MYFNLKANSFRFGVVMVILLFATVWFLSDLLQVKETYAAALGLPEPNQLLSISTQYEDVHLKGLRFNESDPFQIEFIFNVADNDKITSSQLREQANESIEYFLTAMTTPEENLWVNLSPYEKDRILSDDVQQTQLGQDLIGADYVLKQLSASLTSPDTKLGQDYWSQTQALSNSLNKVWILPKEISLYADNNVVFLDKLLLDVKSENDYMAQKNDKNLFSENTNEIFERKILPQLRSDVNAGKNFTKLRALFSAVALGVWAKEALRETFYSSVYVNKSKTDNFQSFSKEEQDKLFDLYLNSYRKGVYKKVLKQRTADNQKIKKMYFSGGVDGREISSSTIIKPTEGLITKLNSIKDKLRSVFTRLNPKKHDKHNNNDKESFILENQNAKWKTTLERAYRSSDQNKYNRHKENPFVREYLNLQDSEEIANIEDQVANMKAKFDDLGYLEADNVALVKTVENVFEKLRVAVRKVYGVSYTGKVHVVDSNDENAMVFANDQDVYIHKGLLKLMIRYFDGEKNEPFSEDHIAALLAHEITHWVQSTTMYGLHEKLLDSERQKTHEFLAVMRNAEYNADEGAVYLTAAANLKSDAMFSILEMFHNIERPTSIESIGNTHASFKERIRNLDKLYTQKELFLLTVENYSVIEPKTANSIFDHEIKAIGYVIEDIKSDQALIDAIKNAKNLNELIRLMPLAQAFENAAKTKLYSKIKKNKKAFGRYLAFANLSYFVKSYLRTLVKKDDFLKTSVFPDAKSGTYIKSLKIDESKFKKIRSEISDYDKKHFIKEAFWNAKHDLESCEDLLNDNFYGDEKDFALKIIEVALAYAEKINNGEFDEVIDGYKDMIPSEVHSQEKQILSLNELERINGDVDDYFQSIIQKPYAYCSVYGNSIIDSTINNAEFKKIMGRNRRDGLENVSLAATKEKDITSGVYIDDVRTIVAETEQARNYVYKDVMMTWIYNNISTIDDIDLLKLKKRFRKKIIKFLPPFSENYIKFIEKRNYTKEQAWNQIINFFYQRSVGQDVNIEDWHVAQKYLLENNIDYTNWDYPNSFIYEVNMGLNENIEIAKKDVVTELNWFKQADKLHESLNKSGSVKDFTNELKMTLASFKKSEIMDFLEVYSEWGFEDNEIKLFMDLKLTGLLEILRSFDLTLKECFDVIPAIYYKCFVFLLDKDEFSNDFMDDFTSYIDSNIEDIKSVIGDHKFFTLLYMDFKYRLLSKENDKLSVDDAYEILSSIVNFSKLVIWSNGRGHASFFAWRYSSEISRVIIEMFDGFSLVQLENLVDKQRKSKNINEPQGYVLVSRFMNEKYIEKVLESEGLKFNDIDKINLDDVFLNSQSSWRDMSKIGNMPLTVEKDRTTFDVHRVPTQNLAKRLAPLLLTNGKKLDVAKASRILTRIGDKMAYGLSTGNRSAQCHRSEFFAYLLDAVKELSTEGFITLFDLVQEYLTEPELIDDIHQLIRNETLEFKEKTSYLEAIASRIDMKGVKADFLHDYDNLTGRITNIKNDYNDNIDSIVSILGTSSMSRDGFFDMLEIQLIPKMYSSDFIDKIKIKEINKVFKGSSEFIKKNMVDMPRQWDLIDKVIEKITKDRAEELLPFYIRVIPMICDPQKRLRYGALGYNLFLKLYPDLDVEDKLEAVSKVFFPVSSEYRDEILKGIVDTHPVIVLGKNATIDIDTKGHITPELYDEINRLLSINAKVRYQKDETQNDAFYQGFTALVSPLSRADRVNLLYWIMNPEKYEQPQFLRTITEKKNIDFSTMPYDLKYVPTEYKKKILFDVLLGENGIFSVREGSLKDQEILDSVTETMFETFFPSRFDGKKEMMSEDHFAKFKKIFSWVISDLKEHRRAEIAIELMLKTTDNQASFGEMFTTLLVTFGPAGVKLGQILAENNVFGTKHLQRSLGTLRSGAEFLSKVAAINVLRQEIPDDIAYIVEAHLADASMGVVFDGKELKDDQLLDIVLKILRPIIERQTAGDIKVLDSVAKRFKNEYNKDVSGVLTQLTSMLGEEKDVDGEIGNRNFIHDIHEDFKKEYGETYIELPEFLNATTSQGLHYSAQRKLSGVEYSALSNSTTALKKLITRRGLEGTNAAKLRSDAKSKINQLRQFFLYQVFERNTFHADLHQGNVMILNNGNSGMIDFGLLGRMTDSQTNLAKKIVKNTFLRDADAVITAVETFLQDSFDDEMVSDIRSVMQQDNDVYILFREILSVFISKTNFSKERETLIRFMKGFSQALWLFPLKPAVLRDMAPFVEMSDEEVTRAFKKNIMPTLKYNAKKGIIASWAAIDLHGKIMYVKKNVDSTTKEMRRLKQLNKANDVSSSTLKYSSPETDFGGVDMTKIKSTSSSVGTVTFNNPIQNIEDIQYLDFSIEKVAIFNLN